MLAHKQPMCYEENTVSTAVANTAISVNLGVSKLVPSQILTSTVYCLGSAVMMPSQTTQEQSKCPLSNSQHLQTIQKFSRFCAPVQVLGDRIK